MNKHILVGNLGTKPDSRETKGGTPVVTFRLATTGYVGKDDDGKARKTTEWHNIVAWGLHAELCEKYLSKGSKVAIEGEVRTRSYEKDGETRYITETHVKEIEFLDSKKKEEEE